MLFALVPLAALLLLLRTTPANKTAWRRACDAHLLPHVAYSAQKKRHQLTLWLILLWSICVIFSLSGPSIYQQPVPVYQDSRAHIILLDLSTEMLNKDLSPNRLQRAKFKLTDLFKNKSNAQFALIAYTREAFVVAPLTDDAATINALIPELSPSIMPVNGNRLDNAIQEASLLITRSQITSTDILVITPVPPTSLAIESARALAAKGSVVSILPLIAGAPGGEFSQFARAGKGQLLLFTPTSAELEAWLVFSQQHQQTIRHAAQTASVWRDDGRWLLLPAGFLLLLLFQRNRLEELHT